MARKRRLYTPEFKAEAVKLVTEKGAAGWLRQVVDPAAVWFVGWQQKMIDQLCRQGVDVGIGAARRRTGWRPAQGSDRFP